MNDSIVREEDGKGKNIIWIWENIEVGICLISMISLTIITFLNVVLRYIFGSSIPWAEEVCAFLIIWLTYGGSAYAFRKGAHIGIEALIDKLPPKAKFIATIANHILTIIFFCIIGYFGWKYMMLQYANNQVAPVTRMTVAVPMSAIPIGSVMIIARLIYQIFQEIKSGIKEV